MLGLDLLGTCEVADRPRNFKNANKDRLYTTHEYPEFVSVVTIRWTELVGVAGSVEQTF
jgi:hypothetical protein